MAKKKQPTKKKRVAKKKQPTKKKQVAKKQRSTRPKRPTKAELPAQALRVLRDLKQDYPVAICELTHESPFQLLAATILSAQ
ncbi:MAG: endonuclease III, partial [Actinomycetota bacterium]